MKHLDIKVLVGAKSSLSRDEFIQQTPRGSIALDGAVRGGPFYDEETIHLNLDHHEGVVRLATMSTARQTYFAIKGGVMGRFLKENPLVPVYVNDCDQDVSLAVWLLDNYKYFEGTGSIPVFSRLIELSDRLDVTGGAFPMILDDEVLEKHNWIFEPYQELRKSGALGRATPAIITNGIEACLKRLDEFRMGNAKHKPLDIRHEILYESPHGYKIVNELGGNEARYFLFSKGMQAFISLVATPEPGKHIWTVGRISPYIPFPVSELYDVYNKAEGRTRQNGWNGSDMIGGHRGWLSNLSWQDIAKLTDEYLTDRKK